MQREHSLVILNHYFKNVVIMHSFFISSGTCVVMFDHETDNIQFQSVMLVNAKITFLHSAEYIKLLNLEK